MAVTTVRADDCCSSVARAICATAVVISLRPPRIFFSPPAPASTSDVAVVGDAESVVRRRHSFADDVLQRLDDDGDIRCGFCRAIREIPDLFGNDSEAAARIARARGLDRGVERQQIRALGDQIDRVDDAPDFVGALAHFPNDRRRLHHRVAKPADALDGSLHRRAAIFCVPRDAPGHLVRLLRERGDGLNRAFELRRTRGRIDRGVADRPSAGRQPTGRSATSARSPPHSARPPSRGSRTWRRLPRSTPPSR